MCLLSGRGVITTTSIFLITIYILGVMEDGVRESNTTNDARSFLKVKMQLSN
jgi:hypothetical protein